MPNSPKTQEKEVVNQMPSNNGPFNVAAHHKAAFAGVIENFFASSGVEGPTKALHDLLTEFMISDNEESPKSKEYVNGIVQETTKMMSFLASLHERWQVYEKYLPQQNCEQQAA